MIRRLKKVIIKVILIVASLKARLNKLKAIAQDEFLYFKVKSYVKARGFFLHEPLYEQGYLVKSYTKSQGSLLPGDDSRKGRFSTIKYSPATLESLDSMILSKLQLLQFNMPLQEAKFLTTDLPSYGFAAAIPVILGKCLAYSCLYNRTLLFDGRRLTYDFCYEPISSHRLEDIKEYGESAVRFNFLPQKEKVVYRYGPRTFEERLIGRRLNFFHPATLPNNLAYIRGLILDRFLKLKPEYESFIEEKRKEIGFSTPIIGVHIRHGEVLTIPEMEYRRFPLQTYLEIIEETVDKTGIKTVFVTTDSEEALRQLPKDSGIDFIYDDKEKRYDLDAAEMLRDRSELRKQETLTAVKNLYLLADCDHIIGTDSSWIRVSQVISYYRKKKLNVTCMKRQDFTGVR